MGCYPPCFLTCLYYDDYLLGLGIVIVIVINIILSKNMVQLPI